MKRVSFKVAKAIKKAGYPHSEESNLFYYKDGSIIRGFYEDFEEAYAAPYAMVVWLWLWREKKYRILLSASNQRWSEVHGIVTGTDGEVCESYHRGVKAYDATDHRANHQDPEEAIIAAIEYLVDNDLIK